MSTSTTTGTTIDFITTILATDLPSGSHERDIVSLMAGGEPLDCFVGFVGDVCYLRACDDDRVAFPAALLQQTALACTDLCA